MKNIPGTTILLSCTFVFLLFSYTESSAQVTLQGIIIDSSSGDPIQGANVFIEGSSDGSSTDNDGRFRYDTDITGEHKLIASIIGHKTISRDIIIDKNDTTLTLNFELLPDELILDEIVIQSDNSEWIELYEIFVSEFIGTNQFASETTIENRWVIDFVKKPEGDFTARANEPIMVHNHALGYRKKVKLSEFFWQLNERVGYYYYYEAEFEYLEPEDESEQHRWNRNREQAYLGSFTHFLDSLFEDNLRENQFEVVRFDGDSPTNINESPRDRMLIQELRRNRIPMRELDESVKAFSLTRTVDILYGRKSHRSDNRIRSRLTPQTATGIILVRENATLVNPKVVGREGRWAKERIANTLPSYYRPD